MSSGMGTMVMVIIATLAVMMEESYLVDICLIYAMISFLAVIVLSKVIMGVRKEEESGETPREKEFTEEMMEEKEFVEEMMEEEVREALGEYGKEKREDE